MSIPTRVLNLSLKKQILLSNRLQTDFGLSLKDDLRTGKAGGRDGHVQFIAKREDAMETGAQPQDATTLSAADKNPKRLVAYVVPKGGHKIGSDFEVSELQDFLKDKLPDYMIPSSFTFLEKLPRNSNGKINYHALPNPDPVSTDHKSHLDSPRTLTERELKKIWSLALGIDQIGIHDNFFNLGGHSLLVARIVSQIRATFGVDVAMRALFEYPTLTTLGQAIDTLVWAKQESAPKPSHGQSDREEFAL